MPAKRKADLARRRRWSLRGVIAWIIYRQYEEVQRAEETVATVAHDKELAKILAVRKKPLNWSLIHVVQGTHTPRGRIRDMTDPATLASAIVEAENALAAAEKDGQLLPDAHGLYSSAAVKKLFPSKEGYGGKRQPRPHVALRKAEKLGRYMVRNPPEHPTPKVKTTRRDPPTDSSSALQKLWALCLKQRIISENRRRDFRKLRGEALAWAQRDLEARARLRPNGLTDKEVARQRTNLAAWKKLDAAWARSRA